MRKKNGLSRVDVKIRDKYDKVTDTNLSLSSPVHLDASHDLTRERSLPSPNSLLKGPPLVVPSSHPVSPPGQLPEGIFCTLPLLPWRLPLDPLQPSSEFAASSPVTTQLIVPSLWPLLPGCYYDSLIYGTASSLLPSWAAPLKH